MGADFYVARPDQDAPEGAERLTPCAVTRAGGTDQRPLVRLDLAQTREAAIALQGMELLAAGGELDALPFYRVGDLIGLRVETVAGKPAFRAAYRARRCSACCCSCRSLRLASLSWTLACACSSRAAGSISACARG